MKMRMAIKSTTGWIANNLRTNPVPKIVSGLALGALLLTGATMVFGSSQAESLVYSAKSALNEQMPYFEETLYNRDQRHQQRVAAAEAKESTIALNEQMPYFEETLYNRDQQWERRNPTTGSTGR